MRLYDLTHALGPEAPVFPGDEPVRLRVVADLKAGQAYTARRLELGTHSGTHVDAPAHLIRCAATLDRLSLDLWVGEALLLEGSEFDGSELGGIARLLLAGCPSGIPPSWARKIVAAGVRLLGVEGPSVDPVDSTDLPSHRILLEAGIPIIENLRLEGVPRGRGLLYCLPLAIPDADGAPARVLWTVS